MNIFFNVLFIFVFIIGMFYLGLPNITNDHYIQHKLIIFSLLFIFQFMIQLIDKIRLKESLNPQELISESFKTAMVGVIGYSVYIDLNIMKSTKDLLTGYSSQLMATISIISLITLVKIAEITFSA